MADQGQLPGAAEGTTKRRWAWWQVLLAVLFLPVTVLWWVWLRSAWPPIIKVAATVVVVASWVAYGAWYEQLAAQAPRVSAQTPAAGLPLIATPAAPASSAEPSQLLEWTYFGDAWPLTVPEATVECRDDAVVAVIEGTKYAVNGEAMQRYPEMPAIRDSQLWRESKGGTKVDIGPILDTGLGLCEGKTVPPKPLPAATAFPTGPPEMPVLVSPSAQCSAAFEALVPIASTVEVTDPRMRKTVTQCANVAEFWGGLRAHPGAFEIPSADDVTGSEVRSYLYILCTGSAFAGTPVCSDFNKRGLAEGA